jgi:hypothetical protein
MSYVVLSRQAKESLATRQLLPYEGAVVLKMDARFFGRALDGQGPRGANT